MADRSQEDARLYEGLDAYINDSRTEFEDRLGEFVEVPTISMDPERKDDIRRGAELAKQYLEDIGATAEVERRRATRSSSAALKLATACRP